MSRIPDRPCEPPLPTARLLVIRHGQSEWNALGRWQGQADPPLSAHGRRQAGVAGLALGMFAAIWSSDLQRAASTARIIAGIIGLAPVRLDQRLRETDVGPWEGLTRDEVDARWPGFLDTHARPEGFEPYDVAAARMAAAMFDIAAATPQGDSLVISHGGVIRAVRRDIGAEDRPMQNLSGSWFTIGGGHIVAGEIVELVDAEAAGLAL